MTETFDYLKLTYTEPTVSKFLVFKKMDGCAPMRKYKYFPKALFAMLHTSLVFIFCW